MKENSYSRNLKKRWLEGYYVGESVRNGVEVWEGLSHQDKSKFWKCEKEKEDKKRCAKMPRLSLACLLYTSPSPRDRTRSRMPSSA